ncbi:mediator of RNA polymerase II transcription subunit 8-like [Saccoglossus kowalevskii]|uniref:Mediator of RNA polymerase II transcription subunit 8 n=1 Tax=Saccoglossus kowalevskii TaxID=10224 RepID=A0ABM0GIV6_SACKO|nr:PREDICTED: mediator of RNA polymerase II transcription subunit 8-like [Saccoglossus kowalevskii]
MQNQEKALELSLEAMISRVQDLKNSITQFIMKLEHEHETLDWPSVLDSFAIISSQINTLNKVLKSEKTPPLRNFILLPLVLAPERDEDLEKLTEGRVPAFNHEVVPNYLRTKAEPDIEEKEQQLMTQASQLTPEMIQQQITNCNRLANKVIEIVGNARDEWDVDDSGIRGMSGINTSQPADTNALITAVSFGKGLKIRPVQQAPLQQPSLQPRQDVQGKAPSSIKTNIKPSIHPYTQPGRPGQRPTMS